MAKTLEELKRENEAAEAAGAESESTVVEEQEAEEVTEEETEQESEEGTTSEETDSEDTEVEPWMQTDEQTSDDSASLSVPVAKHAQMRSKLKGAIREQSTEIEALRAEIQALKGTKTVAQQPQDQDVGPLPVLEDYDHDRDKYDKAVKEWFGRMNASSLQQATQQAQQASQQQQATQRLNDSVDEHYQRAEQLIEKAKIAPEVYSAADSRVRQMIESIRPGYGEQITDQFISVLGDGSEKVVYHLGNNRAKLAELQSMLINDQSGMQAMKFLGQISADINTPRQQQSRAPKPAPKVRGDSTSDPHKSLKKKYDAAKTTQAQFNIRMEAKKAGANVSDW